MTLYYLISAVLAVGNLAIVAFTYEVKRINHYILVLMSLMALSNGGYLFIALSSDVHEAILANKVVYLGGCFAPLITLLLTCAVCNYSFKMWLKIVLYLYACIVYAMVLTIGINDLYYTEAYLGKYKDVSLLVHSYGIGHNFFYILLYGYMAVAVFLLVRNMIKRKSVSLKNLWVMISIILVNIVSFLIGRTMFPELEIMPLLYVIVGWILLYMYHRGIVYNIDDNITNFYDKQEIYGYIMLDRKLNYLGGNDVAVNIFPELSECRIDRKFDRVPQILEWIKSNIETGSNLFSFEKNKKHYECYIDEIRHRGNAVGYMLEFREDTDKLKYMKLLAEHNAELEDFQEELEKKVKEQTQELQIQQKQIKEILVQTVTALSEAVDAKDRYTSGHSKRVAKYSCMIAEKMGKSKEEQEEIYQTGLLHDVGKIRIPEEIINKPGKLTDEEFNIMKIHPVTGYNILSSISTHNNIAIGARYHHERYDGKGYPNGLAGENIPEIARILGVADSYDAMASNRSYRNALPQEVIRSEIEKGKGTQFDPQIADIMLQIIDSDKEYTLKEADSIQKKILTVDDEAMNNKIIAHIMQDEPRYQVVSAGSGREALKLLEQQPFDLILLDVKMPEMDGIETLRKIREICQTPVVFMTSERTLDISTQFSNAGCDEYITKPFTPILVKEIIYNVTNKTSYENDVVIKTT